jgi:hypothetical protein
MQSLPRLLQNLLKLSTLKKTFDGIKWALTHAPVLLSPVESVPYEVVSNALGIGLEAVLLQEAQRFAFESQKLSPAERNYTTTEQELLGIIHTLRAWKCYLEEIHFEVITDHCLIRFSKRNQLYQGNRPAGQTFSRDLTFSGFIGLAEKMLLTR